MRAEIFVEPHEKHDALEAYDKYISEEQMELIEGWDGRFKLDIDYHGGHCILWFEKDNEWVAV